MGKKRSVVIREQFAPLLEAATDEQVGKIVKAMLQYQRTGEAEIEDTLMAAVFEMIKEAIDEDNAAYEETCQRRKDAAHKRWGTDADGCNDMQEHASACKSMQEDADMDLDLEPIAPKGAGGNKRARAKFVPPTVEEVRAYVKERGSRVDPEAFVDFYASKGWKVGNQTMKDWKAAVRTWERREPKGKPQAPPGKRQAPQGQVRPFLNKPGDFERTDTDWDDIERQLIRAQRMRHGPANTGV